MNKFKLNTFISTFNIVLVIVGYNFVSTMLTPVIDNVESSMLVTVPYSLFALFISFITILLNLKSKFKLHSTIKVLLVFWLLLLIRFFYDMYLRTDVNVYPIIKLRIIAYMIPMTIIPMYSVMKSYKYINFEKLLFWSYSLLIITVIMTYFSNTAFQELSTDRAHINKVVETITTGHIGLTTLMFTVFYFFKRNVSKTKKLFFIFIGFISFLIFLRSGSRGPVLSLIIIISFVILGLSKRKLLNLSVLLIIVLMGFLLQNQIMEAIKYFSPSLYGRFMYKATEGGQLDDRTPLFLYAINSFNQNPLFGKNFAIYSGYGGLTYAHNVFFDTIMQLGIIGGVLITYILLKPMKVILKLVKTRSPYFMIGLILLQDITKIIVSGSFYFTPTVSILLVLLFMPLDRDNYSLLKLSHK